MLADLDAARERGAVGGHDEVDLAADEPQREVRQQRAGEEAGLAEDLEAVADAEHRAAGLGELDHLAHHRREASQRTDAQVVAVGEAAGDDDRIDALQIGVAMPEQLRVADGGAGAERIDLVAGAGEANDSEAHGLRMAGSTAGPREAD